MNILRSVVILLAIAFSVPANGALGLKMAYFSPRGDMGQFFKKAPTFELFFVNSYRNEVILSKVGVFYTNLKPRLDTFPIYDVSTDFNNTVYPGYLVYNKYRMYGVFIDQMIRVYKTKKISFSAGLGISVGYIEQEYDYAYETVIISNGVEARFLIGGIRPTLQAMYHVNDHLKINFEVVQNWLTDEDWAGNYSHRTFGISAYYYFIP